MKKEKWNKRDPLTICFLILFQVCIFNVSADPGNSIKQMGEEIFLPANKSQGFHVVQSHLLDDFLEAVEDTLKFNHFQLAELKQSIKSKQDSLKLFSGKLNEANLLTSRLKKETDSIEIFGFFIHKMLFVLIVVSSLIASVYFLFQLTFKSLEIKPLKTALEDKESEITELKRISVDRERKLLRELTDLKNRN
jgi:hypothetical protein